MDRESVSRTARKIQDAAKRASRTAWEVEDNLNAVGFFGRDVFGTVAEAENQATRLIAEINDLVTLRDELKAAL